MKKRNQNHKPDDILVIDAINAMKRAGREDIESDTEGSYRGVPEEGRRPVQDADDL